MNRRKPNESKHLESCLESRYIFMYIYIYMYVVYIYIPVEYARKCSMPIYTLLRNRGVRVFGNAFVFTVTYLT